MRGRVWAGSCFNDDRLTEVVERFVREANALHCAAHPVRRYEHRGSNLLNVGGGGSDAASIASSSLRGVRSTIRGASSFAVGRRASFLFLFAPLGATRSSSDFHPPRSPPRRRRCSFRSAGVIVVIHHLHLHVHVNVPRVRTLAVSDRSATETNGPGFEPGEEHFSHFVSRHAQVRPRRRGASVAGQEGCSVIPSSRVFFLLPGNDSQV